MSKVVIVNENGTPAKATLVYNNVVSIPVEGPPGPQGEQGPPLQDVNTVTGVGTVQVWTGTQTEYDAITTPDPQILYFIK